MRFGCTILRRVCREVQKVWPKHAETTAQREIPRLEQDFMNRTWPFDAMSRASTFVSGWIPWWSRAKPLSTLRRLILVFRLGSQAAGEPARLSIWASIGVLASFGIRREAFREGLSRLGF